MRSYLISQVLKIRYKKFAPLNKQKLKEKALKIKQKPQSKQGC